LWKKIEKENSSLAEAGGGSPILIILEAREEPQFEMLTVLIVDHVPMCAETLALVFLGSEWKLSRELRLWGAVALDIKLELESRAPIYE